jgi:hypothetical protein
MQQLKPVINFLKKNLFWLSSILMAIFLVVAWYLASQAVDAEKEKDIQTLTSKISELEGVMKVSAEGIPAEVKAHPNDVSKQGMEQRLADARQATIKAWKVRREAQEPVMVWPDEVLKNPEFLKFFEQFSPPEGRDKIPQEKVARYLQIYTREIPKRMPELCAIIGAEWNTESKEKTANAAGRKDDQASGDGKDEPSASGTKESGDGPIVVRWNDSNRKLWQEKLSQFKGFDGNTEAFATAYQVFALQQDLWLLEAMFKVIKQVNGDADANDLAAIREIDHVAFGREARAKVGSLSPVDTRLAEGAGAEGTGADTGPGPGGPRSQGSAPASGGALDAQAGATPLADLEESDPLFALGPFHGRYVDAKGEPLPIQKVHDVMKPTNKALPEQDLELVVARRVPVRVALKMEESKIPAFIAACANSPFCFEINQIRLNRHKPGENIELHGGVKSKARSGGGSQERDTPTMGGAGGSGTVSDEGGGEDSNKETPGGSTGPMAAERRTNLLVEVEFTGFVKIYNKVDEARLLPEGQQAAPNDSAVLPTGGGAGKP